MDVYSVLEIHTTICSKGVLSEANPPAHIGVVFSVWLNVVPGMVVWYMHVEARSGSEARVWYALDSLNTRQWFKPATIFILYALRCQAMRGSRCNCDRRVGHRRYQSRKRSMLLRRFNEQ